MLVKRSREGLEGRKGRRGCGNLGLRFLTIEYDHVMNRSWGGGEDAEGWLDRRGAVAGALLVENFPSLLYLLL